MSGNTPTHADICRDCRGTPEACICAAYDRVTRQAPDPEPDGNSADWHGWMERVIANSNAGRLHGHKGVVPSD